MIFSLYFCVVEKIIEHIETLLSEHDCVIVPGLGAFIVNVVSASWTEKGKQLAPPYSVIYFNPSLQYDDGLLTETLRITHKTTYRKAARNISQTVAILHEQLQEGKEITFGRIGKLTMNKQHKIEFRPTEPFNFLPENIGLFSVRVSSNHFATKDETQLVVRLPHVSKYAATAAAVLLLIFLFPTRQFHTESDFARLNPFELLTEQTLQQSNTVTQGKAQTTTVNQQITPSSITHNTTTSLKQKTTNPAIAEKNWHLVVATFETESQAKNFVTLLANKKNMSFSVIKLRNLYRIINQSFANKDTALAALQTLRKHPAFETAWVMYDRQQQE